MNEVSCSLILSPGPASLTEMHEKWVSRPLSLAPDTFRCSLGMKEAAGVQEAYFLGTGTQ